MTFKNVVGKAQLALFEQDRWPIKAKSAIFWGGIWAVKL
jgi:hypothetical protein